MSDSFHEQPLKMESENLTLYGIESKPSKEDCNGKLIIFVPAKTGTRIGPQRIFVEASRYLCSKGYACFRFDFDHAGDSESRYEINADESNFEETLTVYYKNYLELVYRDFSISFEKSEITIVSISIGCIPILNFALTLGINSVIFLSPNHLESDETINKENLKAYWQKLFSKNTYKKLFLAQINFGKIAGNIINMRNIKSGNRQSNEVKANKSNTNIFAIYGSKDPEIDKSMEYWTNNHGKQRCNHFDYQVVEGADHSFFGWRFKRDVVESMLAHLHR